MENQIWPTKQPDGTIYERHVYGGPQGEGFTDIFYRENAEGAFDTKRVHVGPEQRETDSDYIPSHSPDRDIKFKQLKEGKAEWKPSIGFEVIEIDEKEKEPK